MPKRKKLIPWAVTSGPDPDVQIDDETWRSFEAALGNAINPQVRAELVEATNHFLMFAVGERAEPMTDAKRRIDDLKTSAEHFLQTLIKEDSRDARSYADQSVALQFGKPNLYDFTSEMMEFVAACERAANSIASTSDAPHLPGWDGWIHKLTKLMKTNGLPFEARKDSDKSDRVSPFVCFLDKLQRAVVAPTFRRGDPSLGALAGEIVRARAGRIPEQKKTNKTRTSAS